MILEGLKNYFRAYKYFFTILGVFSLGVVLGLSALLPGVVAAIKDLTVNVSEVVTNVDLDYRALMQSLTRAVTALNWAKPEQAIGTLFDSEWLNGTLNDGIHSLLPEAESYGVQITAAVTAAIEGIISCVVVFVVFSVLGFAGGFMLAKFLIKRSMAKKVWWKNILSSFFDLAVTAALAAVFFAVRKAWVPGGYLALAGLILVFSLIALFKAYLFFGLKKVDIKEIVNDRNVAMIIVTDLIIILLTGLFTVAVFEILNYFAGVFLSVAIVPTGLIVITYNAEAYVKSVVEKRNNFQNTMTLKGEN